MSPIQNLVGISLHPVEEKFVKLISCSGGGVVSSPYSWISIFAISNSVSSRRSSIRVYSSSRVPYTSLAVCIAALVRLYCFIRQR